MSIRKSPRPARSADLLAYGIAFVSAAVSMAQGGIWASLAIFGLSIVAAVVTLRNSFAIVPGVQPRYVSRLNP
jgi:hypothetical protein